MAEHASPDIRNYYIGKGQVFFKETGETHFVAMGNCPSYKVTPNNTVLDHFSSMSGVKKKDRSVVTEAAATVAFTLEEYTIENLRLALLGGEISPADSEGKQSFAILAAAQITGQLKFIGQNDVGSRFTVIFNISNTKGAGTDLISDEWGQIEFEWDLLAVEGEFGTVELEHAEDDSDNSESL